jgi:hypothetical protein
LTNIVVLRDLHAVVKRSGCGSGYSVVPMLRTRDGVVKARNGLAHEISVWGSGFNLSAACVTVPHTDDARHINLSH